MHKMTTEEKIQIYHNGELIGEADAVEASVQFDDMKPGEEYTWTYENEVNRRDMQEMYGGVPKSRWATKPKRNKAKEKARRKAAKKARRKNR